MASNKNKRSIKSNPELFSDEAQTVEERILDKLEQEKLSQQPISEKIYFQHEEDIPQAPIASIQERITHLLDKVYNGDHDVEYSHRFDHQEEYRQELITVLKQCGITYVAKPHFPVSDYELHVIRMDFFGRIRQPSLDRLGTLYKAYLNLKDKGNSQNTNLYKRKKRTHNPSMSFNEEMTTYSIDDYTTYLNQSQAWKIYRLFPRFHHLEYRMLKTIQSMHIPPEQLPLMNVYDFSDVLYRAFRKSDKSRDAHLFLGARQAFIKDVFRKHELWIRDFLKRQNVLPRYIDALIITAQSKGVTNGIHIASDSHTFMSEYATAYAEDFQNFIIQGIKSDNYANTIRERIQNNAYTIEGGALNFLQSTQNQLTKFIKKSLLEKNYTATLYDQFSNKVPTYVLDNIKNYIKENPQQFSKYLQELDIAPSLQKSMAKRLPDLTNPEQWQITKNFIINNQDAFFVSLLDNSYSVNYARFVFQTLDNTPQLTDFGKDIISSFIIAEAENPANKISPQLIDDINSNGLTKENIIKITPYIRTHFSALNTYFKENNVLTFGELQNELIENNMLLMQNNAMPESMHQLHKSFILSNSTYFKDWYINFHIHKYKERAADNYNQLALNGINEQNSGYCFDFIKERLGSFIEFAAGYNLSSSEIIHNLNEKNLLKNQSLNETVLNFIVTHSSTFKNFLLQSHLKQKESNFELLMKQIKHQGLTEKNEELAHKFIIDNMPLYKEYQRQNKQINQQSEQIYDRIIANKPTTQDKSILNEYLNQNIYNYMIFQQDNSQLLPYVKNIIQNIKHAQIGPTEEHWLKGYCDSTSEQFSTFLTEHHYLDKEKSELFVKNIKFAKKNMIITFDDGYILQLPLEVHHKSAAQDSGEIKSGTSYYIPMLIHRLAQESTSLGGNSNTSTEIDFRSLILGKNSNAYTEPTIGNIAQANDFSRLCIFPTWWHKIMHSLDKTESFDNKERFVARLMPTDRNIIFFGSEKPEDQLCYDYTNDPRTKRYQKHLSDLVLANKANER